ncbi:glycosyltransferase [Candidatus Woesearchaeota archaeon]|nr:glycosyltransferase [Candidatus Woesearchaeota archaeon]
MRIAVFTDNYFPETNGLVTSMLNQIRFLGKKGHEYLVFSPGYSTRIRLEHARQYGFFSIPIPSYKISRVGFPDRGFIRKVIHQYRPDVIHVHTPFLIGRAGIKAGKEMGIPTVGTYHTKLDNFVEYVSVIEQLGLGRFFRPRHRLKKKMSWLLTNAFYRNCDVITTPSRTMKRELVANGSKNSILVVSNGVDLKTFTPKKDYSIKKRILHVGRVSYEKRIDVILRAMQHIREDIHLTIAGTGPALGSLKELRDRLGLKNRVRFTGNVRHKELCRLHHTHDIFVTASDMETQGLAALEAAASGMPIICVDKMAVQEIVDGNGYVVRAGDYMTIAEHANRIICDQMTLEKMGRKSRSIAEGHDLKKVLSGLESVYKAIIAKKNQSIK